MPSVPARSHDDDTARKDWVWTPFRHYDWPDHGDLENMPAKEVLKVKMRCWELDNCAGFSVRDGTAWLKKSTKPLHKEDLHYMGDDDPVLFFTLAPAHELAWQEFRNCDYPNRGDVETVESTDLMFLKRHAEQHGYAGFGLRGNQAYMKGSDWPLGPKNLTCSDDLGPCAFYLPVPEERAVGASPYVNTHLAYGVACADAETDCKSAGCCQAPGTFCFEVSASTSRCLPDCPLENPDCRLVGSPRVKDTSLFCFSVVMARSLEFELVDERLKQGAGLALCEEYIIYSSERVMLSNGDVTVPLKALKIPNAKPRRQAYEEVWSTIIDHYIWRQHEWIVQVDAHTLLFANQLKLQLHNHEQEIMKAAAGKGLYVQTCKGQQPFTKGLQIISQDGIASMGFHMDKCQFADVEDETVWLQRCLEAVQAHPVQLSQLFVDTACAGSKSSVQTVSLPDCSFQKVAFHPLSSSALMDQCISQAQQMSFK